MEGLAAGGPTKTGHKTPAVIVNLPMRGTDEATVRANQWMVEQVLGTGVHGIYFVHATTAGAVRALLEEVRYPNREQGMGPGLLENGTRGAHGSMSASKIWGVSDEEYERTADVWPLNPNGDIIIGVKIEDKYGLANLDEIVKVPGIAFGEGGLSDMSLSLGFKREDPGALEIEGKIFAAAKARHLNWTMNIGRPDTPNLEDKVRAAIKEGRMFEAGEETARIGRKITNRPHPWPGE
jgi:4-hydroxy-2-oxoheptanedioate aldolase